MLEFPRAMTVAELAGGYAVPRSADIPDQLKYHFLRRIEALPDNTQQLMLVAAAEPTGDVALLWRAAQIIGIEPAAANDADRLAYAVRDDIPMMLPEDARALGADDPLMHR